MDQTNLGKELSFLSINYPAFRGNTPPLIAKVNRADPFHKYEYIGISLHSLSHIDLPWCIEDQIEEIRKNYPRFKPLPEFEKLPEVMERYSTIREFDAVVLKITEKRDFLEEFLDDNNTFIKTDISPDAFEELMAKLEITEKEIKSIIPWNKLKQKLILFMTGYDKFSNRGVDFGNSYFEFRHSYLLHPYLSLELIEKMIEELEIQGIGSDSYGLENPIHFTSRHTLPHYARDYYKKNAKRKLSFRPVLAKLMTEGKIYIKNLRNMSSIEFKKKKKYVFGKLTLIPFALGNRDANLVRVFFKEEV